MGSLLNTIRLMIHFSWVDSKGPITILIISSGLYCYNYNASYKQFVLLNIFALNLLQLVILNRSLKSNELIDFLNFYNVECIIILISRILFLYVFLILHLTLLFGFSHIDLSNFFILNLLILVFIGFRIGSWSLKQSVKIGISIFLLISQIAIILFTKKPVVVAYNITLLLVSLSLLKYRSIDRLT